MNTTEKKQSETIKALQRNVERLEEALEELEWRTNSNRNHSPAPPKNGALGALVRRVIKRKGPRSQRHLPYY